MRLGLDEDRSWIILTEANRFTWPGPDLRILNDDSGIVAYGLLPQALFDEVTAKFLSLLKKEIQTLSDAQTDHSSGISIAPIDLSLIKHALNDLSANRNKASRIPLGLHSNRSMSSLTKALRQLSNPYDSRTLQNVLERPRLAKNLGATLGATIFLALLSHCL